MHDVVPVGHELLVDVVLVEQRHRLEPREQVVADVADQVVRLGVRRRSLPGVDRWAANQSSTMRVDFVGELLELGGVEDGLLHLATSMARSL